MIFCFLPFSHPVSLRNGQSLQLEGRVYLKLSETVKVQEFDFSADFQFSSLFYGICSQKMDIFNALLTKLLISQGKVLCQLKLTVSKAIRNYYIKCNCLKLSNINKQFCQTSVLISIAYPSGAYLRPFLTWEICVVLWAPRRKCFCELYWQFVEYKNI